MAANLDRTLRERRRVRAAHLHERGWRVTDIAKALSVSQAAVSQWLSAYRTQGEAGLRSRPRTGAPRRRSERHDLMLRVLLRSAPRVHDIDADVWDRTLVQRAIKRLFGVSYSLQHCGRLLRDAQKSTDPIPRITRLELDDLLRKADIARLRTRLDRRHGKRSR